MRVGTAARFPFVLLLLAAFSASSGCVATTREMWLSTASTADVERLALAEGHGGSSLVIHAEGNRWLLPLDKDGQLPLELDYSRWGGWSLEKLRADHQAKAQLSAEPSQATRFAWSKLRRTSNEDLKNHEVTPLHTRVFRVGDSAVIAFYDDTTARGDECLPVNAVLLPERLPRTRTTQAARIGRAVALTPITLALDAIGTAFFVPAAIALNPRYATNMIVWINTDEGEFPPPLLFHDPEER